MTSLEALPAREGGAALLRGPRLQRDLAAVAGERFDVAVIGGGITGAGVARHAARAGLKTLLLESDDFAAGTSSRSTKLIHGGLRYLAMGEVALVREGALERKSLRRMAPHLAQPRWMVLPAANRRELWKLRTGIATYEKLGAVDRADRHRNWDRGDLAELEPLLDRREFPFACAYQEYLTDDARLVIAALRSAVEHGASVCNYARLESFRDRDGEIDLVITDALGGGRFGACASVLVNAAGPWVEAVNATRNDRHGEHGARLHLSKGVHIAVARDRLPISNMIMMTAADGRPVFAIPRDKVTYVGTTDTSVTGGPGHWPEIDTSDVSYLLAPLARYFGGAAPGSADVVGAWAGLRPLIDQPGKAPKEMSRKQEVWVDGRTVTVAGGKLTGFRKMAEQVLEQVGRLLGRSVALADPLEVLPGGDCADVAGLETEVARRLGLDAAVSARLVRLYGSEVFDVLGEGPQRLSAGVFAEEIDWAVHCEGALSLVDLMYRRLRLPWFRPDEVEIVANAAVVRMARSLGWDESERARQRATLAERLCHDLAFRRPGD